MLIKVGQISERGQHVHPAGLISIPFSRFSTFAGWLPHILSWPATSDPSSHFLSNVPCGREGTLHIVLIGALKKMWQKEK